MYLVGYINVPRYSTNVVYLVTNVYKNYENSILPMLQGKYLGKPI
jgi:hypothetical protein